MTRHDTADERLQATIVWAKRLHAVLEPLLEAHGDRVHFRPGAKGIAMVGLLPERPQRGKSRVHDLEALVADFEVLFAAACRDVPAERITGESALTSYLVRESYRARRRMRPLEEAAETAGEPVSLVFVTDAIVLPIPTGKMASGLLALRRDGGRRTPVLLQIADERQTKQILHRLNTYGALLDAHAARFGELFSALLGEDIHFDAPAERWLVWPAAVPGRDPQEGELGAQGIRVVAYKEDAGTYRLRVGGPTA